MFIKIALDGNEKRTCPFSPANLGIGLDEIQYVAATLWFVEAHFFSAEELFKENCAEVIIRSIYYMFIIVMCKDTFEPIGFKLVMVLNSTELYSLIPVWTTLMFTHGHRVTGKIEVVQSFCYKVAWSSSDVHDGWLCKEDDCEEVM